MNSTRTLLPARRARASRGAVMLEALIASAVFAVGVLGAYQGIIIASRQNSMANRMVRAAAISQQIRSALEVQGYERLKTAGLFTATSDTTVKSYGGGLETITDAIVVDFDAYEGTGKLMAGFSSEDKRLFKRVLVAMPEMDDYRQVAIVIYWTELGQPRYHKEFVMLLRGTASNGSTLL